MAYGKKFKWLGNCLTGTVIDEHIKGRKRGEDEGPQSLITSRTGAHTRYLLKRGKWNKVKWTGPVER